jgi:parallel beta-helix repeat protein
LEIKKDDVTIQGGNYKTPSTPDPNRNIILINSARRVSITGVNVTGGKYGISISQGGSLTLDNSTISKATSYGVLSSYGSSVNIKACIIQGNTLEGVMVTNNSALSMINSTITANGRTGVVVTRSSSAQMGHSPTGVPGLNTITGNSGNGLSITRSAFAAIDRNTITGNSGAGIDIEGASATVTNNTIADNQWGILIYNSGNARIGINEVYSSEPNTIENNVYEGISISNSAAAYMLANTIRSNGRTTGRPGVSISRASGQLIGDNKIQENGGHGVGVNQGALLQGVGGSTITAGPDIIKERLLGSTAGMVPTSTSTMSRSQIIPKMGLS